MPEQDTPRPPVAGRRPARPGIEPVPRTDRLVLSLQQEDLWFLDRLAAGRPVYNVDFVLRFHGELDVPALERAATALVARHESLRTRFGSEHGVPYQVIDAPAPVALPVIDLSGLAAEERARRERELIEEGSRRPYDLERGPLLRLQLLRLGPAEHALLLSASHLVVDGWSVQTVVRELGALYEASRRGEPDPLPPLPVQYADFAAWQRSPAGAQRLQRQLDHWAGRLAGLPALDFPADRPRPDRPTWAGQMAVRRLPDGLYDELEALARAESTYLLPVVLAGFLAVLASYTGQDDLAVGTAASGRVRRELNDQVGFYVNMLVLRCPLPAPDPTFRELLAVAGHTALDALGHQEVPFGRVVTALRPDRESNRNPLFQVALVLQIPKERVELPGLAIEATITWELGVNPGTSRFDLTVNAGKFGGEFQLLTEFSTELFDAGRIDRLHGHLQMVLEHAVRNPDARLSELLPLTEEDRRQLAGWRQRTAPEPAPPAPAPPEDEGPRTPTEEALADIWLGVFGAAAEGAGVHESFFAIGGSSLQAVELMTRVQEAFPVELDLRDVFTESSIAQLGTLIDRQLGLEGLSDEEVLRLLQAEEQ